MICCVRKYWSYVTRSSEIYIIFCSRIWSLFRPASSKSGPTHTTWPRWHSLRPIKFRSAKYHLVSINVNMESRVMARLPTRWCWTTPWTSCNSSTRIRCSDMESWETSAWPDLRWFLTGETVRQTKLSWWKYFQTRLPLPDNLLPSFWPLRYRLLDKENWVSI